MRRSNKKDDGSWHGKGAEQQALYQNRRRVQGEYGKRLLRRRGELLERSFAHCYDTGGMRRTYLGGGQNNILKRQLIHVGAFNLSLIPKLRGAGTPRKGKNRDVMLFCSFIRCLRVMKVQLGSTPPNFDVPHEILRH